MSDRPVAIYPGRFQPFHKYHLDLVKVILRNLPDHRLIIAVADWQGERTRSNFLTGREAAALVALGLADCHLDGRVDVQTIALSPERGLKEIIKCAPFSLSEATVFSGSAPTCQAARQEGLKVFPISESQINLHAQTVRDSMIAGDDCWKNWLTPGEVGYIINQNLVQRLRNLPEGPKRPWGIETNTSCPPSGRERV